MAGTPADSMNDTITPNSPERRGREDLASSYSSVEIPYLTATFPTSHH